jgi:hypothetical protein
VAQRPGETFSHSVRNAPAGQPPQSAQAPSESPPQPLRYEFDGQSEAASHETQRLVPDDVLYLPGPHATQLPAAMPTHPSLFSPGGQIPQDSQTPGEVPYFPASHGVQEVLLECEVVPASQDAQVADDVAPNAKEKEPAGHIWHSADAGVE